MLQVALPRDDIPRLRRLPLRRSAGRMEKALVGEIERQIQVRIPPALPATPQPAKSKLSYQR